MTVHFFFLSKKPCTLKINLKNNSRVNRRFFGNARFIARVVGFVEHSFVRNSILRVQRTPPPRVLCARKIRSSQPNAYARDVLTLSFF